MMKEGLKMTDSVMDRIKRGFYSPGELSATRPTKPRLLGNSHSPKALREHADLLEQYEAEVAVYAAAVANRDADAKVMQLRFREDIEREFDTTNHPKRVILWEKAAEYSEQPSVYYAYSMEEFYNAYESLSELLSWR